MKKPKAKKPESEPNHPSEGDFFSGEVLTEADAEYQERLKMVKELERQLFPQFEVEEEGEGELLLYRFLNLYQPLCAHLRRSLFHGILHRI